MKLFDRLLVVPEILLAADENDRKAMTEVENLGDPLIVDLVSVLNVIDQVEETLPSLERYRESRVSPRRSR